MTEDYWFWLTFPGGVVIGLVLLSPFAIGYGIYAWIKSAREERDKAERLEAYRKRIEELRNNRALD